MPSKERLKLSLALAASFSFLIAPLPHAQSLAATTISMSFSGDVLAHNSLYLTARTSQGYDFKPMFEPLKPSLRGTFNICHLETPLTDESPASYPVFSTPTELAAALKSAGFDGCSVASNHSLDQGTTGVLSTIRTLQGAGLKYAGARKSRLGPSLAWYKNGAGIQIAHLSYTYGLNGRRLPADKPWLVNLLKPSDILKASRTARMNGADLVVVSLHWGNEYQVQPTSSQRSIARQLTASSAIDLVVGHHAHVVQPAELVNGKPVLFGLGNLWSGQGPWANQPTGQHGVIATLNFEFIEGKPARYLGGTFIPTLTTPGDWSVRDARRVTKSTQKREACRAIKSVSNVMRPLLNGPSECPTSLL